MMPFALWNWMHTRRAIDAENYRPSFSGILIFAVVLIALGVAVVLYLWLAARQNNPTATASDVSGDVSTIASLR